MKLLVSGSTATMRKWLPTSGGRLGVLLTPANGNSVESILKLECEWAADNGCFGGLDEQAFLGMLDAIRGKPRLKWVTCPDVVAWSRFTRQLFKEWAPELESRGLPIAYVLQDGETISKVPWDRIAAVFVGGSTTFKVGPDAKALVFEAKQRGKLVHMGRVNSESRLMLAHSWGCDSVDGTSMSCFGETYIPKFLGVVRSAEQQRSLIT